MRRGATSTNRPSIERGADEPVNQPARSTITWASVPGITSTTIPSAETGTMANDARVWPAPSQFRVELDGSGPPARRTDR